MAFYPTKEKEQEEKMSQKIRDLSFALLFYYCFPPKRRDKKETANKKAKQGQILQGNRVVTQKSPKSLISKSST